jgi:hypothetical protein
MVNKDLIWNSGTHEAESGGAYHPKNLKNKEPSLDPRLQALD